MIRIVPVHDTKSRVFGWIQDPSSLRSLCDVVAIFDSSSAIHKYLVRTAIPRLVSEKDGRDRLIHALAVEPLKLKYTDLAGSGFTPRSSARCNGIVQAAVKGQVRPFISNWPADNFVRWAHAFGFIKYDYDDDSFEITEAGLRLSEARLQEPGDINCAPPPGGALNRDFSGRYQDRLQFPAAEAGDEALNEREQELLVEAALSYPPAVRILELLKEGDVHLTKFEIGNAFGFVGEGGFTTMPQNLLIQALAEAAGAKERNAMKADWEGSSDKYARMIAKWLVKLKLLKQVPKKVTVTIAGKEYCESIGQAYVITAAGLSAKNRALGKSRHRRIAKRVLYEMLSPKALDREYLRTRRAFLIKFLNESKRPLPSSLLAAMLEAEGIRESAKTVEDDIQGLRNIGLTIQLEEKGYLWADLILDFDLPIRKTLSKSALSDRKDALRQKLDVISHQYLSLVDLAYDGVQNRLLEMGVIQLLTEECGFMGMHLGGSRKPDGIVYTGGLEENYGIIIDTKAYSKGYSLPISQADEMERYVRENQTRSREVNPNGWWDHFEAGIRDFYFLFVAGHFTGSFASQIQRISMNTGVKGGAIPVEVLLLLANALKKGECSPAGLRAYFCNGEIRGK